MCGHTNGNSLPRTALPMVQHMPPLPSLCADCKSQSRHTQGNKQLLFCFHISSPCCTTTQIESHGGVIHVSSDGHLCSYLNAASYSQRTSVNDSC
jgi:hypothetical protein